MIPCYNDIFKLVYEDGLIKAVNQNRTWSKDAKQIFKLRLVCGNILEKELLDCAQKSLQDLEKTYEFGKTSIGLLKAMGQGENIKTLEETTELLRLMLALSKVTLGVYTHVIKTLRFPPYHGATPWELHPDVVKGHAVYLCMLKKKKS